MEKTVFCKINGKKLKVGTFVRNLETGEWTFYKNKAHLFRMVEGYGIQKEVFDETGVKSDMAKMFSKHPDLNIVIKDVDNGNVYKSKALDWLEHYYKGNYGEGRQMFLSIQYMQHEKI